MKTEEFKKDLAIEITARFIGSSRGLPIEKRGFVDGALWAFEKHCSSDREELLNALERINAMSEDHGREGCTYGDTKYDSLSAAYGYNQCLQDVKSIASALISKLRKQ